MRIPVDITAFKMKVVSVDIWKRIAPALEELGYVWGDGTSLSNFYPLADVHHAYGLIFGFDKSVTYCSSEFSYNLHDCPELDYNLALHNQHCSVSASEFE